MRKQILIILVIVMPLLAVAQLSPLDRIFDKYSGREGYTTVTVAHSMFELFSTVADDKQGKDFKDITSKLSSIKILSMEAQHDTHTGNDFYREVLRALAAPGYEELMTINDEGEESKFMVKKNGGRISELVMVVGGKEACVIALEGDIDLRQVSKLSKSMNIKGFDHLNSVGSKAK